jgi:hypothetical protein
VGQYGKCSYNRIINIYGIFELPLASARGLMVGFKSALASSKK